jgi:hypothetical protein
VACSLSCGGGHAMNLVIVKSLVKHRRAHHATCASRALRGDRVPCAWSTHPSHAPPAWAAPKAAGLGRVAGPRPSVPL